MTIDNSPLNSLVFKYGYEAKNENKNLKKYVQNNNSSDEDISLSNKLGSLFGDIGSSDPLNGISCNDNNPITENDIYINGTCLGESIIGKVCNDQNIQTITDVYNELGICSGINVEGQSCSDENTQTINDIYHNGICLGTNIENQSCDDNDPHTNQDKYINGICVGVDLNGQNCNDNNSGTINDKYIDYTCTGELPKSCYYYKEAIPSATDGVYTIDPDGTNGEQPFSVTCDMVNGGWTQIPYTENVSVENRWTSGDAWRYLPTNFTLGLTNAQIDAIRSVSTQGKQTLTFYCKNLLAYYYPNSKHYGKAIGFKFQTGINSNYGTQIYTPDTITVVSDSCRLNDNVLRSNTYSINNINVPVLNVLSHDNGNSGEAYGFTALTTQPAWLK